MTAPARPSSTSLRHRVPGALARRLLALLVATGLWLPLGLVVLPASPAAADVTEEQLSHGGVLPSTRNYRVAPGLEMTTFSRLEADGWNNGNVLTADLTEPTLSMDLQDSGTVASRAPLTDLMRHGKDGGKAVAAINGTFFDIDNSDAPVYTSISRDGMRMGSAQSRPSFTIANGRAAVQALAATGQYTVGDRTQAISGVNHPRLPVGTVGLYNESWGTPDLDRAVGGPDQLASRIARATVVDGVVTEVSNIQQHAGAPAIPAGGQVLLGREEGADAVAALQVGDRVDITVGPDQDVEVAVSGSDQLVKDGQVVDLGDDSLVTSLHPRTAIGVSKDGSKLVAVVIDGRSSASRGMRLDELAALMRDLGAYNALNLDGGGSSALAARVSGADGEKIWNSPSDGQPREVANALVFYSDAPDQQLADVQAGPAIDAEGAVFPGFHRSYTGTGLAANLDPVMADGAFTGSGDVEVIESSPTGGVVRGTRHGSGTVTYAAGAHQARQELRVLGAPVGLTPSERSLNLAEAGAHRELTLSGYDGDGQRARIETRDAKVEVTPGFTVTDDGIGTWSISSDGSAQTGSATFTAGGLSTAVALTAGTSEGAVLDLGDPDAYTTGTARATMGMGAAEGPIGADGAPKPAIGLTYDFTTASATRGAYLIAKQPVTIDGRTLAIEMDVRGDGTGAWPRIQVRDAAGTVTNIDGEHLEFDGWKRIRFTVPEGLPQPLTVERVRIMETRPEAKYKGDIAVSDMRAITTPAVETPAEQAVHDPALLTQGTVEGRAQRIAVMSDAQFVARDPDSPMAEGARRTLREIKAAKPDLLVIDGDLVDEGSPEDLALARRILDEEWGDEIPYVYVPGNHEVMGGKIDTFREAFGGPSTQRNLGRTKVITLDSSSGSLRGGGIDQIADLERTLAAAKDDDTITGVTIFFHHPPADPLPDKASQLGDQREARALEQLLAGFRRDSGKSAAVINGHVGAFHGSSVEGVTYLINGNSGKNPAGTPETGGFTGWTMLGIDPGAGLVGQNPTPADRTAWLAAETHPWVDSISLEADEQLAVGATGSASASILQDGRTVPVGWPVTAQWGGQGVQVDDGSAPAEGDAEADESSDPGAIVRINPATGEITGLRAGTATLTVTVNGKSAERTITVAGDPTDPTDPTPTFTDVTPGIEHYDDIMWLADQGITTGYPDGTFRPTQAVNRDAMAEYLYRMAGSPAVTAPRNQPFSDVTPGMEHYDAIIWAHQAGIVRGYGDGTFRPTSPITRDAMAAFLYRYAGSPEAPAPTGPVFTDVAPGAPFATEIAWMKAQGLTTGWPDGSYRPSATTNRDAMAAFLHRMREGAGISYRSQAG